MRRAAWIAGLSRTHKEIIGLYLNDFYEETMETAKGGHSAKEFRRIIAVAKAINPRLAIWAPCYPPDDLDRPYDFGIDAIIFGFYDVKQLPFYEALLDRVRKKFPGRNEGKLAGLRVFRVQSLIDRPDDSKWLKESLTKLQRR